MKNFNYLIIFIFILISCNQEDVIKIERISNNESKIKSNICNIFSNLDL
jgi:hypothetical protein